MLLIFQNVDAETTADFIHANVKGNNWPIGYCQKKGFVQN